MLLRLVNWRILRNKSRISRLNIPLVNENIDDHLFASIPDRHSRPPARADISKIIADFDNKGIFNHTPSSDDGQMERLKLPKLLSNSIVDHTDLAATGSIGADFESKIDWIFNQTIPVRPKAFVSDIGGWIKYTEDGQTESIPYPLDDCLVFDTENIVTNGHCPVMTVALSKSNWYSWLNPKLLTNQLPDNSEVTESDLIDFGEHDQVLIGHNVSFDRTKVKGEYNFRSKKVFLDTMSFHNATHGVSHHQQKTKMIENADIRKYGRLKAKNRYLRAPEYEYVLTINWSYRQSPLL